MFTSQLKGQQILWVQAYLLAVAVNWRCEQYRERWCKWREGNENIIMISSNLQIKSCDNGCGWGHACTVKIARLISVKLSPSVRERGGGPLWETDPDSLSEWQKDSTDVKL